MSDPCISSTPVTVDADSLSPEPVVKEKRVSRFLHFYSLCGCISFAMCHRDGV